MKILAYLLWWILARRVDWLYYWECKAGDLWEWMVEKNPALHTSECWIDSVNTWIYGCRKRAERQCIRLTGYTIYHRWIGKDA